MVVVFVACAYQTLAPTHSHRQTLLSFLPTASVKWFLFRRGFLHFHKTRSAPNLSARIRIPENLNALSSTPCKRIFFSIGYSICGSNKQRSKRHIRRTRMSHSRSHRHTLTIVSNELEPQGRMYTGESVNIFIPIICQFLCFF